MINWKFELYRSDIKELLTLRSNHVIRYNNCDYVKNYSLPKIHTDILTEAIKWEGEIGRGTDETRWAKN